MTSGFKCAANKQILRSIISFNRYRTDYQKHRQKMPCGVSKKRTSFFRRDGKSLKNKEIREIKVWVSC